jgi:hypothetical protein
MEAPQNTTGICYVTIKDQKVKIRFGIPACRSISELLLSDTDQVYFSDGKLSEVGIAKLIFYGYTNQCIVEETAAAFTFEDFMDWVELKAMDNDLEEITTAAKTWADSRITKKMLSDVDKAIEDSKKKRTGTKK